MITSNRTLVQSKFCFSGSIKTIKVKGLITYLQAGLFVSRLFSQPASGEGLLVCRTDEDTAFTVLGSRAAMKTYAGSAGDIFEDG